MADTGASIRVIPFKSGGLLEVGMSLDRAERSLHVTRYGEWAAPPRGPVGPGECVGYKVPFFLGGDDSPTTWRSSTWTSTGL